MEYNDARGEVSHQSRDQTERADTNWTQVLAENMHVQGERQRSRRTRGNNGLKDVQAIRARSKAKEQEYIDWMDFLSFSSDSS